MTDELIYDWNAHAEPEIPRGQRVMLCDETLRDGLQNPSVRDPSIGEKIEILHLMDALGIDLVNIGLPGAGPRAFADTERLAREIIGSRMKTSPEYQRAHAQGRHSVDDRHLRARGPADRSGDVFGFEPDPPLSGGLDRRAPAAHHGRIRADSP